MAAVEEEAVVAGPLCGLPETFHCDDKNVQCIESSKKCNGISECHGGFDESVIVCGENCLFTLAVHFAMSCPV